MTVMEGTGLRYSRSGHDVTRLTDEQVAALAESLTGEEAAVILRKGTEAAFCGNLVDSKRQGTYICRLCGLPLFASDAKFTSGTGWPSFFQPVDPDHIGEIKDASLGMVRTEIVCQRCGGHLGHVFDDGPKPTSLRYCLNSISLDFHVSDDDLPARSQPVETHTAYFAGGCFWGIEDRFQQVPGVIDAVSGYQGGDADDPTYKQVCSGDSGHAETVRVVFDPKRVTYRELLESFFTFHDPTQLNRQGPDVGTQYRSAIFAADDDQLAQARAFVEEQKKTERFAQRTITTQIERASPFYEAEAYHQDYNARHGRSCALPTE
ncbi:MAG: bifunctional methionine sulfoxide reductase B/A protein [Phycisphaerales bacterium]|nr:bifunctional methionine sulfoxide reductase B/A protein [Phycisphaerales bacterium]